VSAGSGNTPRAHWFREKKERSRFRQKPRAFPQPTERGESPFTHDGSRAIRWGTTYLRYTRRTSNKRLNAIGYSRAVSNHPDDCVHCAAMLSVPLCSTCQHNEYDHEHGPCEECSCTAWNGPYRTIIEPSLT
jgi:hypothetical protein